MQQPGACFVEARARAMARLHDTSLDKAPAGGVDEPEQPVSAWIGRYQLGTSPVASHCESERIECDVSISESHCGASAVPSADDAPKVAANFFMKSRKAR